VVRRAAGVVGGVVVEVGVAIVGAAASAAFAFDLLASMPASPFATLSAAFTLIACPRSDPDIVDAAALKEREEIKEFRRVAEAPAMLLLRRAATTPAAAAAALPNRGRRIAARCGARLTDPVLLLTATR
jgi:hypothetical protein